MIFDSVRAFLDAKKPILGCFLSIDLGTKKTGIAVSCENLKLAFPSCIIYESSLFTLLSKIKLLMEEKECKYIVLGFPFAWEEGHSAERIMRFAKMLELDGIDVLLYDENRTSVKVRNIAFSINGKMTKKEKQSYDAEVAALILQNALDEINVLLKLC